VHVAEGEMSAAAAACDRALSADPCLVEAWGRQTKLACRG
jgi:hypothetical protein